LLQSQRLESLVLLTGAVAQAKTCSSCCRAPSEQHVAARFADAGSVGFAPKAYNLDLLRERLRAALDPPRDARNDTS
jgi:hypothetical protein